MRPQALERFIAIATTAGSDAAVLAAPHREWRVGTGLACSVADGHRPIGVVVNLGGRWFWCALRRGVRQIGPKIEPPVQPNLGRDRPYRAPVCNKSVPPASYVRSVSD